MNVRTESTGRDSESPGYVGLRERAVEILAEEADGLDAPALAQQLFGAGSGERWVALLPAVLAGEPRLEAVDGRWHVKERRLAACRAIRTSSPSISSGVEPSDAQVDGCIVTLALATTGADPRRHRIARIAVVRYEDGEVKGRFDAVVNSGRRLSRSFRDATGMVAEDLDAAPSFADLIESLCELLDGRTVYAYGARRARAFIDAEVRRAEFPATDVRIVEVDTMVAPLLPGARKPGLFAAAEELGIQHNGRGSPLAEAELSARVLARVRERFTTSPPRPSLDLELEPAPSAPTRPLPFTQEWLRSVPEAAGIYIFEDETGRPLYVGKAVNLRRRLATYVGNQPSLHRRLEGLAVRATAVTTIPSPSDLEAVLLEARLIRERKPSFNVARQTRPPATIVRAAPDAPSPSVRLVSDVTADGARYIGPFESVSAARQALAVARAAYPEAFARRRGDIERQRQAVLQVCRLLSGQKQPTLALLHEWMQAAARSGDQGEVDRLRTALRDVQVLATRHSDLAGLADGWRLLALERIVPGLGRLHLIHDGQLIASATTDTSALPTDPADLRRLADEIFGEPDDDDDDLDVSRPESWSMEDSTFLMRWLVQARSRLEIQRLPPDEDGDTA